MKILGMAIAVAALAAVPFATIGTANAMPVPAVVVGDIAEGGPNAPNPNTPLGTPLYDDFSNGTGDPTFKMIGTGTIFGVVRNVPNSPNFKDAWTMTFDTARKIYFDWSTQLTSPQGFTGKFFIDGSNVFTFKNNNGPGPVLVADLLPGTYTFNVDPTAKNNGKDQLGNWQVSAVVPLPAGGILLLTALGSLAAFRARKKA